MIFFFLILFSFHLFVSISVSKQFNKKNQTCLLPFVTEPCINDGENLSCTFSLNSFERNKTCDLSSVLLIFTTVHIELFIIPQYYNQLILEDKHVITKLIFEPNIINRTYEYLHWPNVWIASIEIPMNIHKFIIIHEMHNLDITRTKNYLNKQYWHLQIWPAKGDKCQRTIFNIHDFTTDQYDCPYYSARSLCGLRYACFNDTPCYFTGYKQLVCQIEIFRSSTKFETHNNISQYETIFINLLYNDIYDVHEIQPETFIINKNSSKLIFITKRLVLIINGGIVQISARFFDSHNDFQIRIEHITCTKSQTILDILDDTEPSVSIDLIDYTSGRTGGIGCRINKNNTSMMEQLKPQISLDNNTIIHAGNESILPYLIQGLPPFTIKWFRNNKLLDANESIDTTLWLFGIFGAYFLTIKNSTKNDNGVEYRIDVTNRFGGYSATTHLNVTYGPSFIMPVQNQTVKKGSNVTLEAKIDGNPTPNVYIQWLSFRQCLYPTNNDQLLYQYNIQNIQSNQSIIYTFSAVSESYTINVSQTAFLTILDPLYAINSTSIISIEEEDKHFNLTLEFSHSIIKTQWFVNDTPIENASISYRYHIKNNQALLIIVNISLQHNGQYKVQAWDILNQTNHSLAIIHVYLRPPWIMYCYKEMTQNRLQVYILCTFQAKYSQIQWINPNGQVIINQSNYESINESAHIFYSKLVFKKLQYKYFGIYTFQVNNSHGSDIRKINFTLHNMPPIIDYNNFNLEKIYIYQSDSYSFIIYFNGIPWPNVTFFFNNEILLSYSDPNASPLSLILRNLSSINEGIYYARVMNSEGFIETNRTEIYILQAPSFITENQQSSSSIVSVKQNQTITLITPKIKTGSPDPLTIIWFVKGKTLKLPFNSSTLHSELTIDTSLQQEQIACVIENKHGETAYFFKLNFLQAPYFILPLPKQIEVELGQNVILTINVTGNPLPTIQWFYDKQIIDNKKFEEYITIDYSIYSLIIRNFTLMDIGNYSVIIRNSENNISNQTQITLKSRIHHFNTISSTKSMILLTTVIGTMKSIPTCVDNIIRIIVIVLLIGLIVILFIPIFCAPKRLLALFDCQKKNIDNNDLIKKHYENNRNVLSPQSSVSNIE